MFRYQHIEDRKLIADLLLIIARPENSFHEIENLKQTLSKITDWQLLVLLTSQNGLIPLLYKKLSSNELNYLLPQKIINTINQKYLASVKHLLSLEAGLIKIHSAFLSKSIDFIVLKGLTLSHDLYEEPSLRPMFDLDVLVKEKDIEKALLLLLELGFKSEKGIKEND